MAINVKHSKVSTIPDGDDSSLIRPSDWNADHVLVGTIPVENGGTGASTLTGYVKGNGASAMTAASTIPSTDITGLGTMASQNANNVTITGGSISGATVSGYIPTTEKAQPLGVATLDAGGKVPTSQIPMQGDLNYQGAWNANTNTPTLTSSTGTQGYYYVVSVAGTTNLNGITDWQVGDWAIFNGSVWQKVDNTDAVTSVNGLVGTVVLTTTNIAEGTNLYYTDARARASISAGTGLSYNSTTGAMNFSTAAVGTWAATPSSANLAAAMTDETGSGLLVFNTAPSISALTIDGANPYIQFNNGSAVTVAAGKMWYDGSTGSLNFGMGGGNITQQVGEELFVYGKASASIIDSPLKIVYQTGTVGASGVVTFAPTVSGITDGNRIIGVATENITSGNFGRITSYGVIHGITTDGTAYGETWVDGDEIWYNPVTGNPTNVKPSAPNIKVSVGTIINAGSGGSGSIQVEINHGSVLGGTDSNVQLTSVTNGNILTYDGGNGYWKNTDIANGTGISVTKSTNGVLTITNTAPSSGGTVTSVSGTGSVNGITLTGTVTSSGSLTLGGTLGSIANSQLTNSAVTINGTSISLGGSATITAANPNALTIGAYLTGTSYNGSSAVTIAADATSANTASKLVARDASGDFSAGVITATKFVGVSGGTF